MSKKSFKLCQNWLRVLVTDNKAVQTTHRQKVVFTNLHVFTIPDSDWYNELQRVDGKSSRALQNVTPFINVIFHPFSSATLNVCEWASHLPQQYYSVQLTGHFPEHKKQRPVCFYGFAHTGDLSGILHRQG